MSTITVGLLGLGSRSTLHYIKELNRLYNEKKGGYSTFPFVLLNANFESINPLLPHTSTVLDDIMQSYINEIQKLNIKHILVPNITLHETIDSLNVKKNIIHPIPLAIVKIKEKKCKTIVLFGSLHSMESSYIKDHFNANGIEVLLPSAEDRLKIDEFRKQMYDATETSDLIASYHSIIVKYAKNNPIVLACTELSITKPTASKNIIDMVQLQIEFALSQTD